MFKREQIASAPFARAIGSALGNFFLLIYPKLHWSCDCPYKLPHFIDIFESEL